MLKKFFLSAIFITTVSLAQGKLFIIGGGDRPEYMMKKFIELGGGNEAVALIIPFASSEPFETGKKQSEEMIKYGAKSSDFLQDSLNIDSEENLEKIQNATAIFFSGGDQNKLTKMFLNTKAYELIMKKHKEGAVIGGTSAGAAIMSEIMITGDEKEEIKNNPFAKIKKGNIATSKGFGFIDWAIVDQHFVYRKRHNRLLSLVLENSDKIGIGIDEATAIIVDPQKKCFDVIGESCVIIYDARKAKEIRDNKNEIIGCDFIETKILIEGDSYFYKKVK